MSAPAPGRWCGRMVELAARMLPADQRERYAREFIAELYGMTPSRQRRHALQILTHAWALRAALDSAGSRAARKETIVITTPRPWKCRFGLHRWDERENPETKERYEICLRCDAYRDRPSAAPGAGAAGVSTMTMQ